MTRPRAESVKDRKITEPVISLDIDDEITRLKREPEWMSGEEDGIALVKYPYMRVVLVALKKGKSMREHKVEGPISLYVIAGRIRVTAEKEEKEVRARGLFTLRRGFLHEVRAASDSVLLLTLMRVPDGRAI